MAAGSVWASVTCFCPYPDYLLASPNSSLSSPVSRTHTTRLTARKCSSSHVSPLLFAGSLQLSDTGTNSTVWNSQNYFNPALSASLPAVNLALPSPVPSGGRTLSRTASAAVCFFSGGLQRAVLLGHWPLASSFKASRGPPPPGSFFFLIFLQTDQHLEQHLDNQVHTAARSV